MIAVITKDSLRRENFEPEEFFASVTAKRLGINNDTSDLNILTCLMVTADKMQEIRDLLDSPIKISSAYRCPDLNRAVGSRSNSQHIQGQAVDFTCPQFGSPEKIVKFLKEEGVEVDQCLVESGWVHLSIKHNKNRNQFAKFTNGEFVIL